MKLLINVLILSLITTNAYAQTVVVVAKNSAIDQLDHQYVANIFLARTSRFPNGDKAQPIELKNNPIRKEFYQSISGKTPKQLYAYWTTLVFTGKGKPPKGIRDAEELAEKLQSHPGMITYIQVEQVTNDMKIVYRFP